jgi:membrane protein YdbS with pleckstrin-like domain
MQALEAAFHWELRTLLLIPIGMAAVTFNIGIGPAMIGVASILTIVFDAIFSIAVTAIFLRYYLFVWSFSEALFLNEQTLLLSASGQLSRPSQWWAKEGISQTHSQNCRKQST